MLQLHFMVTEVLMYFYFSVFLATLLKGKKTLKTRPTLKMGWGAVFKTDSHTSLLVCVLLSHYKFCKEPSLKSFQRCQKQLIVQSECSRDWIPFEQKKCFIKVGLPLFPKSRCGANAGSLVPLWDEGWDRVQLPRWIMLLKVRMPQKSEPEYVL